MKQLELLNKVTDLIGALRNHVQTKVGTGLTDISGSVEVLVAEVLGLSEGLNLKNMNQIRVGFPAIDLADDNLGVAVQVTVNADTKKWKETVAKFESAGLAKKYARLRIIGFCEAVKARACPSYVTVEGPEALLAPIRTMESDRLQKLEVALRTSFDFSKLHPYSDRDCFEIVLAVLDRDAIRHRMAAEGSFLDMVVALREIKEMITTGKISGRDIYAKPRTSYGQDYAEALERIDLSISETLSIVNAARSPAGSHYCFTSAQERRIDEVRAVLIQEVNQFSENNGHKKRIHALG